jgi:ATP/maltotriose-dependent transcriptional regulator MalT
MQQSKADHHLRRTKATTHARSHLTAALDTFQRLGAHPWAARAGNELRATGLTNKQIGERLFLSPRTVATHLYQLFPKLGVTSRAALRDALTALPDERPQGDEHSPAPNN